MQVVNFIIRLSLLISSLNLIACGSTASLNANGQQVTVVKKEPLQCKEIGRFYGSGITLEYAMNNLLNIVGKHGGTHVYVSRVSELDGVGSTFVVGNDRTAHGFAFNCKELVH